MISACLIVLNEEKNMRACILKLKKYIDEFIIVVDTRSTDNTASIARELGASVYIHTFKDFASQRNYALSKVKTPWAFMIDPDEECSEGLLKKLISIPKQGTHDAYRVRWKNYRDNTLVVTAWKTIIFKKHARFGEEIHEHIVNMTDKYKIYDSNVYLIHRKTLDEQLKHLTSYKKIILNLFDEHAVTHERLNHLINDHNHNVKAWLGSKYYSLLIDNEMIDRY